MIGIDRLSGCSWCYIILVGCWLNVDGTMIRRSSLVVEAAFSSNQIHPSKTSRRTFLPVFGLHPPQERTSLFRTLRHSLIHTTTAATTTTTTSRTFSTLLAATSPPRRGAGDAYDPEDMFQRPAAIASAAFRATSSSSSSASSKKNKRQKDNNYYARPLVQWYPGHIAKAERLLRNTLKLVDVVIEVRDARACVATCHPQVPLWCAGKPRVVVLTHTDAIPTSCQRMWQTYYEQQVQQEAYMNDTNDNEEDEEGNDDEDDEDRQTHRQYYTSPVTSVLFVNAKQGQGIHSLQRGIVQAGARVQQKRFNKGLKPRALRVAMIGYPNVGKSALINQLLGKRRAKTANTPGVTRALQWIRINNHDKDKTKNDVTGKTNTASANPNNKQQQDLELLDSPGIIPNSLEDQSDALLLAAINCIGEASYDNQAVAAYLVDYLQALYQGSPQACPDWPRTCQERYGVNPMKLVKHDFEDDDSTPSLMTGEDFLYQVADRTCQGDPEDAARKILQDFRNGRMGNCCLQVLDQQQQQQQRLSSRKPIEHEMKSNAMSPSSDGTTKRPAIVEPLPKVYQSGPSISDEDLALLQQQAKQQWDEERLRRAQLAQQVALEQGLQLPPLVQQQDRNDRRQDAAHANQDNGPAQKKTQPPNPIRDKGLFEGW